MTRRESREAAMCLLYEYSYNTHKTPGEIVNAAVENREEKLSGFTRELFTGACSRLPEIDRIGIFVLVSNAVVVGVDFP